MSTLDSPAASSTACLMLFTVFWILATTPRLTPDDSAFPTPRISILLVPLRRPTVTHIFVVPMSRLTMIGESFSVVPFAFICLFLVFSFFTGTFVYYDTYFTY